MSQARRASTFRYPVDVLDRARDVAAVTDYSLNDLAVEGLRSRVEDVCAEYQEKTGKPVPRRRQTPLKGT